MTTIVDQTILFAGWPPHGSNYIIYDQEVMNYTAEKMRAECRKGDCKGIYHNIIRDHNAACEAMLALGNARLAWMLERRIDDGGKP